MNQHTIYHATSSVDTGIDNPKRRQPVEIQPWYFQTSDVCREQPFIEYRYYFQLCLAKIQTTRPLGPRAFLKAEPYTRLEDCRCPVAMLQRDLIVKVLTVDKVQKIHAEYPQQQAFETQEHLSTRSTDCLGNYVAVCRAFRLHSFLLTSSDP